MVKIPRFARLGLGGLAIFTASAGATMAVTRFYPVSSTAGMSAQTVNAKGEVCKIIARDPNPPINVRSSPVVAPDNIVAKLPNGTQVIVVDEKSFSETEQWVLINAPSSGWIAKKLTVKSCVPAAVAVPPSPITNDKGAETLAAALENYQAGRLDTAIAQAKTIPATSLTHDAAKAAILRWQADWQTAEATFNEAQQSLNQGQWQDVLVKVENFPDNRYWRDKLMPLVRQAMDRKHKVLQLTSQKPSALPNVSKSPAPHP